MNKLPRACRLLPVPTPSNLPFPQGGVSGGTFARFRIRTAGGLGPTGAATDGEVEDYAVRTVVPASGTAILIDDPANPGKKVLVVTGTPQTDHIQIQRRGNLILCKNGCSIAVYNASSIGRIVVLRPGPPRYRASGPQPENSTAGHPPPAAMRPGKRLSRAFVFLSIRDLLSGRAGYAAL